MTGKTLLGISPPHISLGIFTQQDSYVEQEDGLYVESEKGWGKLASQIPCDTCEQKAGKSSRNPHNDQSKEKLTIEEECNSSWAEKA